MCHVVPAWSACVPSHDFNAIFFHVLKVRCLPAVAKVTLTELINIHAADYLIGYWHSLSSLWMAITWAINFTAIGILPSICLQLCIWMCVRIFKLNFLPYAATILHVCVCVCTRFMSCSVKLTASFFLSPYLMLQMSMLLSSKRATGYWCDTCVQQGTFALFQSKVQWKLSSFSAGHEQPF